jgi:phosphatidylinositol alpha-1,6-mannosyltransferase
MKKLLLTLDFPPQNGGVSTYLENLVTQFEPSNIFVIVPKDIKSDFFDSSQSYKIERTDLLYENFWPRWLKAYFVAKNFIREHRIEHIIISHLLPMGYVAMALGLPYTVIIHGMDVLSAKRSPWKRMWAKKVLSRASLVVANSNYTKNQAMELCGKIRTIEVAYPCPANILEMHFDVNHMKSIVDKFKLSNKRIILSVNRLVSRKGNDSVIKAMPAIIKNIPNAFYVIVGNGEYQPELEKLISGLKLQKNVMIVNNVQNSELQYFYHLAQLFVMPSRHENGNDVEGFGIVFLEAALFRIPSIGSNTGGIPEAIVDNVTGALIEPDDIETLSKLTINLLNNEESRKRLGASGKDRVIKEFQWSKQFSNVVKILK